MIAIILSSIVAISSFFGVLMSLEVFEGRFDAEILNYFTNIGNLFAAAVFSILALRLAQGRSGSRLRTFFLGTASMGLALTGIVYNLLLRSTDPDALSIESTLLHVVSPVIAVLAYIAISPRIVRWYEPLWWAILPIGYTVFAFTRQYYLPLIDGEYAYPYFFLNPSSVGLGGVVLYVVMLTVGYIALSYVLVDVTRRINRGQESA